MQPHNLASMLAVAAIIGMTGNTLRKEKQPRKCRLKDCQSTTTHNGGYCCAAHCKLDRDAALESHQRSQKDFKDYVEQSAIEKCDLRMERGTAQKESAALRRKVEAAKGMVKLCEKVAKKTVKYKTRNTMSGDEVTVDTGKPTDDAIEANAALTKWQEANK